MFTVRCSCCAMEKEDDGSSTPERSAPFGDWQVPGLLPLPPAPNGQVRAQPVANQLCPECRTAFFGGDFAGLAARDPSATNGKSAPKSPPRGRATTRLPANAQG